MASSQLRQVLQTLGRATLTDGQLLESYIRSCEEAAFAAPVHRHGPMVWGVCRRMLRNHHDAEDAFQATFLVLVRKAASLAQKEKVANWLYGVAHHVALKARVTTARRQAKEKQVTAMPEPALQPQALSNDLLPLLDQELSRLPDKYREVIVLCDLEGKTRKEAARQFRLPEGTVATRLATARTMLAKRLARSGLVVSGGALAAVLSQNSASAGLPASVASSTIKAASVFAAGRTAATGVISLKAVALAEGALKAMLLSKLKVATAVLVILAVLGTGTVALTQALGEKPADQPVKEKKDGNPGVLLRSPLLPAPRDGAKFHPVASWRHYSTLKGPGSSLYAVAFSPDGKTVAAGSEDGRIKAWDLLSGEQAFSLPGTPGGRIRSLVFAPDSKTLASGRADGGVTIWDLGLKKADRDVVRGLAPGVQSLMFRPNECLIWSGDNGAVGSEAQAGKPRRLLAGLQALPGKGSPVRCTAISRDGETAAWGMEDGTVRLWDTNTGTERSSFRIHMHQVWCVAFSPDGRVVASVDHFGMVNAMFMTKLKSAKVVLVSLVVFGEAFTARSAACGAEAKRRPWTE